MPAFPFLLAHRRWIVRLAPLIVLAAMILCLAAQPLAVSAQTAPTHSSVSPQTVLDVIHAALHSGDSTQNNNCHIGGYDPLPKVPCRHDRILPTSAFLTPSSGGFRTACNNPYIDTYRYYELTMAGQRFKTCGVLGVWARKAYPGEFQRVLDQLGQMIGASVGLSSHETTIRVGGDRQAITASYECPAVEGGAAPSGVKELRIGRNGAATSVACSVGASAS